MGSKIISEANAFVKFLKLCQDESKENSTFTDDISVLLVQNEELLHNIINGNQSIFICEKAQPKIEPEAVDVTDDTSVVEEVPIKMQQGSSPQPLSVMKARQLLSWYTMAQNPNMPLVKAPGTLHPLWVRCDKSDPCATAWLGAETIYNGNKTTGIKLFTVSCKDQTGDEASFTTLDDLKQEHQKRHHPSTVVTKGWAQYNLFCSMKEESMVFESQSSVIASLKWNNVEKILEYPPLSSLATLNIRVAVGDLRSPLYQTHREMEFLLALAEGLRTGEIEWLDPMETQSAVDLTRALVEELENIAHGVPGHMAKVSESQKAKTEAAAFSSMVIDRGDLDFTEQLWEKMRRSVASYQDITDCLKIVVKAVRHGRIKPWIHKDSSSSLSKLILQSYQQQMDTVPLTGLIPANMLLELGLDKIRKDFINYLVGKELTTLNYLSYYLDTEVELQEQVIRVRKLHHLLEILGTCSTFLNLPHDRLFLFTQSCLQYYKTANYDEGHVFQLQIKPALISYFYEKEQPFSWGVEVASGQGSREVKTSLHLSDKPLVDHINFDLDLPLDESVSGENEKMAYYRTIVSCSLISFS
ncbi:protein zwilch homolog isoform X1 [Myxocyprinus asiaticus]|uniref:protein zwilch homolog isoform X1 n=2 Tax=Myxocyprinus asiaticus TaxID=70543 RepID=UPI002221B764|nr:protein zwilch homolog isoform X1 [Myxocyprinus asiaticus]XP_051513066.1 protein zwilch homolog isoform X1 [Myxocyprinus asiaticus]XP_051513067.1 protein zwilch homolog isoform X1 [Myxocyprinus asiaticus]